MTTYTVLRHVLAIAATVVWLPSAAAAAEATPLDADGVLAIRALLRAHNTAELERRFKQWHARGEARTLEAAYSAFGSLTPEEEQALEGWQAARPGSPVAQLALATLEFGRAGRARGEKFANQVAEQDWAKMRTHCARALELANESARLAPSRVEPHVLRMDIARLTSDRALARTAFEQGFAIDPSHYDLWWTYMLGYERRWGGSYQALEQLAKQAQAYADANPRLRNLRAVPVADYAQDVGASGRWAEAVTIFDSALELGELSWIYADRGRLRQALGDLPGALADLDRAAALGPGNPSTQVSRADVLWRLSRFAESAASMQLAADLDPADPKYANDAAQFAFWAAEQERWENFKRNPNLPEAFEYSVRFAFDHAVHGLAFAFAAWIAWRGWRLIRGRSRAQGSTSAPVRWNISEHPELPAMVAQLLRAVLLVIVLIHVWHYGMNFDRGDTVTNGLDIPITAIALVGALAYAHGRALASREFWKVWAVLFPAWNLILAFVFDGVTLAEWPSLVWLNFECLPVYLALFLYGFRAHAIWEGQDHPNAERLTALGAGRAPRR